MDLCDRAFIGVMADAQGQANLADGVRQTVKNRQLALGELVNSIREFRKYTDQALTLRGGEHAHAVQELNKAIDRANGLLR